MADERVPLDGLLYTAEAGRAHTVRCVNAEAARAQDALDEADAALRTSINNHSHTAADVGAAAANHTHTAANVGAQGSALKGSVTIPTTGWVSDTTVPGYAKRLDLTVAGVTANDRAEIIVKPASAAAAQVLRGVVETASGKLKIWAESTPTASISAEYWIERG